MNNLDMEMSGRKTTEETKMEMEMAKEIWKRLLEKVMFDVLARLPIKSIMRFRVVGKRWKEIFQSSEFK